jgi:hypothetical protein
MFSVYKLLKYRNFGVTSRSSRDIGSRILVMSNQHCVSDIAAAVNQFAASVLAGRVLKLSELCHST